jgi:hypothetical protein
MPDLSLSIDLCWLREIYRHSRAKLGTKLWNHACRLRVCQLVDSRPPHRLADEFLLRFIAGDFRRAMVNGDGDFHRANAEAADALKESGNDFFERMSIQLQALLIWGELRWELWRCPTTSQVIGRLEEALGKSLPKRQKERVRETLASILG